jgi:hypothetical protein
MAKLQIHFDYTGFFDQVLHTRTCRAYKRRRSSKKIKRKNDMLVWTTSCTPNRQETYFQNKLLDEFVKLYKINRYCTTAYHPQSNSSIEQMHYIITE